MNQAGRDIIGDIHGQAGKLEALLARLGYRHTQGAWRHPQGRQARFVGDLIDRGPEQLQTLTIVRDMVEAGVAKAVMGNHEYNAIAYGTENPSRPGHHLRIRGSKNRAQHAAFLDAVGLDSPLHKTWIEWFATLPLWLEEDDMRLVHACWHTPSMTKLTDLMGPGNTLTPALIEASAQKGTEAFEAMEAICKGLEVDLPKSVTFMDKQGIVRDRTRVRWWDENARTYPEAAMVGPIEREQLPRVAIPEDACMVYDRSKPVFFGHYWFTGTPDIVSDVACCLDYSAARDSEPLVAYRFDGEPLLSRNKLVAVGPQDIAELRQGPARSARRTP